MITFLGKNENMPLGVQRAFVLWVNKNSQKKMVDLVFKPYFFQWSTGGLPGCFLTKDENFHDQRCIQMGRKHPTLFKLLEMTGVIKNGFELDTAGNRSFK